MNCSDDEDLQDKEKQIRAYLKGSNIHKWNKLKGELECYTNEETLNAIVEELDRRIEREKREEREEDSHFSLNK